MAAADLILCYHRVATPAHDPQLLAVSPQRFAGQMRLLSEQWDTVSLNELAAAPGRGGRVAVTFDDGYADNLLRAAPVLQEFSVPAVVYVVAGNVASQEPFWWDELADLLLRWRPEAPPQVLEVPSEKGRILVELPRHGWDREYPGSVGAAASWSVLSAHDPGPGHYVYRRLYPRIHTLTPEGRRRALEGLRGVLGLDRPAPGAPLLTAEQVAELDSLPGLSVGAHTLRHPVLSGLPPREQRREIVEGAELLASMTGRPPRHFSYPYGSIGHFDDHSVDIVRQAGFVTAVTTAEDAVHPDADLLRLPRLLVRDWEPEVFAAKLREWTS